MCMCALWFLMWHLCFDAHLGDLFHHFGKSYVIQNAFPHNRIAMFRDFTFPHIQSNKNFFLPFCLLTLLSSSEEKTPRKKSVRWKK